MASKQSAFASSAGTQDDSEKQPEENQQGDSTYTSGSAMQRTHIAVFLGGPASRKVAEEFCREYSLASQESDIDPYDFESERFAALRKASYLRSFKKAFTSGRLTGRHIRELSEALESIDGEVPKNEPISFGPETLALSEMPTIIFFGGHSQSKAGSASGLQDTIRDSDPKNMSDAELRALLPSLMEAELKRSDPREVQAVLEMARRMGRGNERN